MLSQLVLANLLCTLVVAAPAPLFGFGGANKANAPLASSDTQNGLAGPCAAMTVIFARGTTETGNVSLFTLKWSEIDFSKAT
jgi:hypothetical protein